MKILLGADGSSHALAAARFLTRHLPPDNVRIDLLRVLSHERQRRKERNGEVEEPTIEDLASRVDQMDWLLTTRGFAVQKLTRAGTPARVLVEQAAEQDYDLVVVGAKGTSETPFLDVGSVALALLEHAPTPVLVVRKERSSEQGNREKARTVPSRVLVPTDGKARSHAAVLRFLSFFPRLPMELVVTTAVEDLPEEMVERLSAAELRRYRWYVEGVAEARLKDMMNRLEPHGLLVDVRRVEGPPAQSVVAAAAAEEVELVVIGTRAVQNTAERHLGGVGGAIARSAPCSVLVVRDGAEVREERLAPRRAAEPLRTPRALGARERA